MAARLASAGALLYRVQLVALAVQRAVVAVVRQHAHAEEEVRRRHMKCGARQRRRSRSRVRARCLAETAHLLRNSIEASEEWRIRIAGPQGGRPRGLDCPGPGRR